jgi:hypothetical protein
MLLCDETSDGEDSAENNPGAASVFASHAFPLVAPVAGGDQRYESLRSTAEIC